MQILDITLNPSNIGRLLMASLILGSLLIVMSLPLSIGLKCLLLPLLLAYGRRAWLQLHQWDSLNFGHAGWLIRNTQCTYPITISGMSTLTAWVTILLFKIPGRRFPAACVIFKDACTKDNYRRLLVALRSEIR